MLVADSSLARTLRLIAATIAIVVAISLPLGYWLIGHSFEVDATVSDAAAHADLVTQRINANPELWRFEIPRLDLIVSAPPGRGSSPGKHYILDERGAVIAQNAESISPPILTRSAPVLDSGTVVGQFVTSRSLVPLLKSTGLMGLLGLVLALAVYGSLNVLPLRAITRLLGELDQERERLRAIVDNAVEGIITFDLQGILQSLNPAAGRMFEYDSAEAVGRNAGDLLPEIDMARVCQPGRQRHLGTLETVGRRRNDARFPIELSLSQAILDGKPQMIAIAHDISERRNAENALRDSAAQMRLFVEHIPAMAISLDENLRYLFANRRYADFFGVDPADVAGRHLREIIGEEAYREVEGHFVKALQGHPVTYQRMRTLPGGKPCYLEVKLLPRAGEGGKISGCFVVTTDITEHRLTEERMQRAAHHDSLTGLPNRLLFDDRLNQAISIARRSSRQFALLYLDFDRFKQVNDSLGHPIGDELLKGAAERIRRQVRASDTVARIGGDEFTVILPDIARREDAQNVADKIIVALALPFRLGRQEQSVAIGASVGIAIYPADAPDADALVEAADAAMYIAKQARR